MTSCMTLTTGTRWMAAFSVVLAAACGDRGNTVTGPGVRASTPTPTAAAPAAHSDLSGDWQGVFTTNDPADCHSGNTHAQLTQTGDHVTGTISTVTNSCGFGGFLDGTVTEGHFVGTLVHGDFGPGRVSGPASPREMHLIAADLRAPVEADGSGRLTPGGHLDLQR